MLRSRGLVNKSALKWISDEAFYEGIKDLFERSPTGDIKFPSLSDVVERINLLEERVQKLETSIRKLLK